MNETFLADLWAAVKQAGPFASMLLLYLLYRVNGEREKLLAERDALLRTTLTAINDNTTAFGKLRSVLGGRRNDE